MELQEQPGANEHVEKNMAVNPESAPRQTNATASAQGAPVENDENATASNDVTSTASASETAAINYPAMTKQELVEALEQQLQKPIEDVKDDVAAIKAAFYAIRKQEVQEEKEKFLANGNEEAAFAPTTDEAEEKVKELLAKLKDKKTAYNEQQEKARQENLTKKQAIIDEINGIVNDPDNINRQFSHVQQLQQQFKEIGEVPAQSDTELWKNYQQAVEKFYDLLKINKELRDYDFKKNLEVKQQLCLEAENLDDEEDIVAAFKRLQELHNQWRETGPVAKEIREEIWQRFKNASSAVNKRYQAHFEQRKADEKENAEKKTALCEQIETIKPEELKTYAAWNKATSKIISLQEEWKKLGFAAYKVNAQLYARFRKSCDEFFTQKSEFFKQMKDEFAINLQKKTELCEKAEALMNSTEWNKTSDALIELQKEWKTIGPVARKHSDAIWKRFTAACDHFFEERKKQRNDVHSAEHNNLKAKKEVVSQINDIVEKNDAETGPEAIRSLMDKWQSIGHVPFKEKDKVYAKYKEAIDKAFNTFKMTGNATRKRFGGEPKRSSASSNNTRPQSERDRLLRSYEQKRNELKTFENNLGFFTASSKSGNSIIKDIEQKISKIKTEIASLEEKIKTIDTNSSEEKKETQNPTT